MINNDITLHDYNIYRYTYIVLRYLSTRGVYLIYHPGCEVRLEMADLSYNQVMKQDFRDDQTI